MKRFKECEYFIQVLHQSYVEKLFTLCIEGILSLLVLGHLVGLVLFALFAVSPAGLRDVHLNGNRKHELGKFKSETNYSLKSNIVSLEVN